MKGMGKVIMYTAAVIIAATLGVGEVQAKKEKEKVSLSNDDCVKCHFQIPAQVEARGMAHKTSVGCTDCHDGHPPSNRDIIPQCSNCHEGTAHFQLQGCLKCHTNPHTPLDIKLPPNTTDACLTCHDTQGGQLKDHPSKHSTLTCTGCHNEHGRVPECLSCHSGHSDAMGKDDCRMCHQAHMPLEVAYGPEVPSASCGACHPDAFQMLSVSHAKHGKFLCAKCHQEKHKMIPQCQGCHGKPHPAGIMAKFPKCNDCHGIAHDLVPMSEPQQEAKKE